MLNCSMSKKKIIVTTQPMFFLATDYTNLFLLLRVSSNELLIINT